MNERRRNFDGSVEVKTRKQAIREFEQRFRADQAARERAHRSVMDGLVIPLIEAGLVDDVTPDDEEGDA